MDSGLRPLAAPTAREAPAGDSDELRVSGQRVGAAWIAAEGHLEAARIVGVLAHRLVAHRILPWRVPLHQREIQLRHEALLEESARCGGGPLAQADGEQTRGRIVELVDVAEAKRGLRVAQLRIAMVELRLKRHRLACMVQVEVVLLEAKQVVAATQRAEVA